MKDFINNFLKSNSLEAFITGQAGSGKTTALKSIVDFLKENNINYKVTAYTHKAVNVLQEKLNDDNISTLHSYLRKRPFINEDALSIKYLMCNMQYGKPSFLTLLIVDEFSFVSESDYLSIGKMQDELILSDFKEYQEGKLKPLKVLYVGDLNQLSPVKGYSAVLPKGDFWYKLTKIHRTDNSLVEPLSKLVNIIEGKEKASYLKENDNFIRKSDILNEYKKYKSEDKVILAYTNKAVQTINAKIKGRDYPLAGDKIYFNSFQDYFKIVSIEDQVSEAVTRLGLINDDTLYNPLNLLNRMKEVKFFLVEEGFYIPCIFGSFNYKNILDNYAKKLVSANKNMSINSKKFYKIYKTLNDYVSCADFNYCLTIHKSQGSEYDAVFVDSKDLNNCSNLKEKLKLMYVAISRAKSKVFLNT